MDARATALGATLRGAEFHRIISDRGRLHMLTCLQAAGELDAEDLADALGEDSAGIRERLSALTAAGVVDERRECFRVHYRLADGLPAWVAIALGTARARGLGAGEAGQ